MRSHKSSSEVKPRSMTNFVMYASIAVIILYLFDLLFHYFTFDADRMFGYLDYQSHWQSLYDLLDGKVLYRDFYWEYGFLTLFLRLPFLLLFGKTFYGLFFSNFIFLPLLGIALSYTIAKQYLNKKSLILFMFMMVLYRTNNDYNAIRHLIPELGLITAILGIYENKTWKKLTGGFLLGISLISSAEYALIANITFVLFFSIYLFTKERKDIIKNFIQTFAFQTGIGSLFLLYLLKNNILNSYISFHSQFVSAFYTNSPCREVFPRISDFVTTFQNENGLLFNIFMLFQRLNIYAVLIVILFLFVYHIRHRNSKLFLLNISLILYVVLAYTRTLNTPCYLHYGVTFTLLLSSSLLFIPTSKRVHYITIAIIIWLCVSSGFQHMVKKVFDYGKGPEISQEKEYLPIAGMNMSKPLVEEYKSVTNYIQANTTDSDYVYVYPDGPYRQLTGRQSPTAVYSSVYYGLVPSLVEKTYAELSTKKPQYIILNIFNSSSFISAVNGVNYNVYSEGKNVIIEGITTKVEDYIQANYDIVEKKKIAWILKRRGIPKPAKHFYSSIAKNKKWSLQFKNVEPDNRLSSTSDIMLRVTAGEPEVYFITDNFDDVNMVKIPIKIDLGIIKSLSKFSVDVYVIANDGNAYIVGRHFVTSEKQNVIVYIPSVQKPSSIKAVMLKFSGNSGFLLFGKPVSINIEPPIPYTVNNSLKIDASVIAR